MGNFVSAAMKCDSWTALCVLEKEEEEALKEARAIAEVTIAGALETHLDDAALHRDAFSVEWNNLMSKVTVDIYIPHLCPSVR